MTIHFLLIWALASTMIGTAAFVWGWLNRIDTKLALQRITVVKWRRSRNLALLVLALGTLMPLFFAVAAGAY